VISRRKVQNDHVGNTESTPNLARNKNVIEMMSAAQLQSFITLNVFGEDQLGRQLPAQPVMGVEKSLSMPLR